MGRSLRRIRCGRLACWLSLRRTLGAAIHRRSLGLLGARFARCTRLGLGLFCLALRCFHQTAFLVVTTQIHHIGLIAAGIHRGRRLPLTRCAGLARRLGLTRLTLRLCLALLRLLLTLLWLLIALLWLRLARLLFKPRLPAFRWLAFLPLRPLAVPLCLTFAVLAILLVASRVLFALRLGQQPHIMLRMLLKVLSRNAVVAQLSIARQLVVFINDLLRRTAHLTLWARAVENAVNDIANRATIVVTVRFRPRTGF